MTQRRILQLAYERALELLDRTSEEADYWKDAYHDYRKRKAHTEFEEIAQLLYNEEHEK